jgi:hypothetical protein
VESLLHALPVGGPFISLQSFRLLNSLEVGQQEKLQSLLLDMTCAEPLFPALTTISLREALLGDEFLQQLVGRLRAGAWGRVEELLIPENVYGDAGLELLVQALVDGCLPALKRLRAADEATSVTEATRARLKDVLSVARPEIRFDMW